MHPLIESFIAAVKGLAQQIREFIIKHWPIGVLVLTALFGLQGLALCILLGLMLT